MTKKKNKIEQGKCPKCGQEDLDYGEAEIDDQSLGYLCKCRSCGFEGTEWYYLEFVGFNDEDGNEITGGE